MRLLGVLFLLLGYMSLLFVFLVFDVEAMEADALNNMTSLRSGEQLENAFVPYSDDQLEALRYEFRMEQWKEKQVQSWDNLPREPFVINASAYTAAADECGKSDGITASGVKVQENRTLACPPQYPFGVQIEIDGMGTYTCEDRGGAIKGNHFDIYMETKAEAFAFGRRNLEAQVVIE